ncbi:hypothetical protein PV416_42520 [Streptomyces ipomoeae]|uniref:hypothetical protein n=1 Tax=Streptomyces ipomoeae TaxID=103232 RepID=UPI001F1C6C1B|nr:hypothetical protein [Streptomyces ipomoeae]MDX2699058.1 hypothetical protein [Streptomyces ipomoeae]MDX2827561.1 hypothetical protein [Streptomyces ipomoeae]MDX2844683.1 hypothetical protein [Streptomyces ipomoeae]MDX2880101.1 hypothetical protein [Streptomyces ipomoeae]
MSDQGAGSGPADDIPRSRISDYVEITAPPKTTHGEARGPQDNREAGETGEAPVAVPTPDEAEAALVRRRRREAAALLGEFRRTAVLVPLGEDGSPLTADFGGIRWIHTFSDESALARFAIARGEGSRRWTYDRALGARLLDVVIPAMPTPYGVALDAGTEGEGALFPPVRGIVPDAAAVDAEPPGSPAPGTNRRDENAESAR